MVGSPQRELQPGLGGLDESMRGRPAEIAVISPTESGRAEESGVSQIPQWFGPSVGPKDRIR